MAEFLKGNHLNSKLDEILEGAEALLIIISPFIKFHSRVKETLQDKIKNDKLEIKLVFGKNEENKIRSMSEEDFSFISQFPNVEVRYEPRLHAKYYANEMSSLLSSMNLYEYSQNNNIEFGIFAEGKSMISNLIGNGGLDRDAWEYFEGVVERSELIFKKVPVYEDKLMGLSRKYVRSEIEVDRSDEIFSGRKKKSQVGYQRKTSPKPKVSEKLLSATALGNTVGLKYKDVIDVMSSKGYIKEDSITAEGKKVGLDYKSNAKGDSWIVYPESLKDIL
jgi:hypothetical protein